LKGAAAGSDDAQRAKNAAAIFGKISGHVFQGRADKKTSGRHLATTWIQANTNAGLVNSAATSIQTFPFGVSLRSHTPPAVMVTNHPLATAKENKDGVE
jgi:hypothetical protein